MQAGQDREYRFFALLDFLVQHLVGFVKRGQTRGAIDDGNGIDIVETLFAIVDGSAQDFCRTCSQDVDGVGYAGARE